MTVFALVAFVALLLASPAAAQKRSLAQAPTAASDNAIAALNYALQLEYLEAEFYSCAAFGSGIPDELRGGGPDSVGCEKADLTEAQPIAEELANDEINHVRFLRTALGSQAAPIPQLDVGPAFAAAGQLASNSSSTFSPYDSDADFYLGAFLFEDVGVTAYEGAAAFYIFGSQYLLPGAQILAVEGYHAGLIRTVLYESQANSTSLGEDVLDTVADFGLLRGIVGAGSGQGLVVDDESNLAAADSDGLAFLRVPGQVLRYVTLDSNSGEAGKGGWFPEGLSSTPPS